MVSVVLDPKGGVGETTLAVDIAATFAMSGLRALLVDSDPQGSSPAWSAAREAPPLSPAAGMAKPILQRDLVDGAKGHDAAVIDGAPRVNDLGRAAILASAVPNSEAARELAALSNIDIDKRAAA